MGLDMKTWNKVCGQIFKRYKKASKKGKSNILDEYSATLKMNRDYLAHKSKTTGIAGGLRKPP